MVSVVRMAAPDVVIRADAEVGEGPVWDERTAELAWVDITAGRFHRSRPAEGSDRVAGTGTLLGAVAPRRAGGWVAAVADGFAALGANGTLRLCACELPEPERRMNDAKCDSQGRLWAGSTTMAFAPGGGALHRWDGGNRTRVLLSGLTLPNGLGWNPAGDTFYLVDSMARRLYSFSFEAGDGSLGQRSLLIQFGASDGLPDGLCVDADGCLWIAFFGGGQVRRYDPAGHQLAVAPMPVSQPSSCAFGPGGVLYITSARSGLTAGQLAAEPHAGSVFALDANIDGAPVGTFAG